jgi:hypothetical protein
MLLKDYITAKDRLMFRRLKKADVILLMKKGRYQLLPTN